MSKTSVDEILQNLPERTRKRLEELRGALTSALGDELEALVMFGSAVRGGYRADSSDVDLVIVLKNDRRELVERIGPALAVARYAARIEAMILRSSDLQRSADVFPLLYDDIREKSVVLHGKSPFEALVISDDHRRLRIEQELREARIRARRMLSDNAGDDRALAGGIDRKVKQVRSPLHALLRLHGKTSDGSLDQVLRDSAKAYGLDAAPLLSTRERPKAAYDALTTLLDAAIADVDALFGAGK